MGKKKKEQLSIDIKGVKFFIKPLSFRAVIELEDKYNVSLQDLSEGLKSDKLLKILLVALQTANPDKEINETTLLDGIDLNHPLFSAKPIQTILGNGGGNPLE